MASINPDSYFIDGLKCAIPKHLVDTNLQDSNQPNNNSSY